MTKFNMVEHHRERHCKNDKGDNPKIKNEMKSLEELKGAKANDTSEYLLMKRLLLANCFMFRVLRPELSCGSVLVIVSFLLLSISPGSSQSRE